jgi:hypothetical protein
MERAPSIGTAMSRALDANPELARTFASVELPRDRND